MNCKYNKEDVAIACFKLFRCIPMSDKENNGEFKVNEEGLIRAGFFITNKARRSEYMSKKLMDTVESELSFNYQGFSRTFYASFKELVESSDEKLMFDQLLHYMTTYGAQAFGVFDRSKVYVPSDVLREIRPNEIPPVTTGGKCLEVRAIYEISEKELIAKVEDLLNGGVAMSEATLENCYTILMYLHDHIQMDKIRNKEMRCRLFASLGLIPPTVEELLRVMFYKATGSSMVISSKRELAKVKRFMDDSTYEQFKEFNDLLEGFVNKYGYEPLTKVFFRHKKLILCFKNAGNADVINKIRRLATKGHIPYEAPLLERLTSNDGEIEVSALMRELDKITMYKKVSLLNALRYQRMFADSNLHVYRIRNGKIFIKEGQSTQPRKDAAVIENLIMYSLREDVKKGIVGKKIYLPKNIDYAFPTSEKNFVGGIPCGSTCEFSKDDAVLVAVHWENVKDKNGESSVDLDLHAQNGNRHIGWCDGFRDPARRILHSGDMTDAPIDKGGAAEALYFENVKGVEFEEAVWSVVLSNYTGYNIDTVPYTLAVGTTPKVSSLDSEKAMSMYKDVVTQVPLVANDASFIIGMISMEKDKTTFTFSNQGVSGSNVGISHALQEKQAKFTRQSMKSQLRLMDILGMCDAQFVDDPKDADISLDPKDIGKATILDMLTPKA